MVLTNDNDSKKLIILKPNLEEWIIRTLKINKIEIKNKKYIHYSILHNWSTKNNAQKIIPIVESILNTESIKTLRECFIF